MKLKVDHIGIAMAEISEAIPLFHDVLGGRFLAGGDNDDTGIRLVHFALPGFKVELMQPLRVDSLLQHHLERRGPGFHHMTFFVDDLPSSLAALETAGFTTTRTDLSSPRWREAFISPKLSFGTLLQFVDTTLVWDEPAPGITLDDVLAGRVVWREYVPCLRTASS
jgi:methylmalonyl-CoA/ethylmalonyl-CoA epimerase